MKVVKTLYSWRRWAHATFHQSESFVDAQKRNYFTTVQGYFHKPQ